MTHFIVLTAAPETGLSDAQIAAVREQLAAPGATRRLSDSASEIAVTGPASADLDSVDVNCIPAAGRRKQLLIADMDSTMIPVECIDEIADFAGVRDQVVAITEPAMRGEISFEEALTARVALLAGLSEDRLQDVWHQRIRLNPGAATAVRTMRANGAHTALISGGFTYFTSRVADAAGFQENRANRLEIRNGALTGRVHPPILGREAKLLAMTEMLSQRRLEPAQALAVGDGANDLAMIGAAGLGVAFRAKPIVAEQASAAITHGDLTTLLYLQGYSQAEFVSD